jgi:hypothetical protein
VKLMFLYSTVSTLNPKLIFGGRIKKSDRTAKDLNGVLTDGGNGGHHLAQLQLVEDGRLEGGWEGWSEARKKILQKVSNPPTRISVMFYLSGGVQADHEDAHLLLAEQALPHAGEVKTHDERQSVKTEIVDNEG